MSEVNTMNDFAVGSNGKDVVFAFPVIGTIPREKALRLAAHIVAIVDLGGKEFAAVTWACHACHAKIHTGELS